MKNNLIYYLFITLSIILNSCTEGFKEEYSKLFIALTEVTAITTPTTDTTPDYTFSSTESGALTYGGSCSSSTTIATTGNNTFVAVGVSGNIHRSTDNGSSFVNVTSSPTSNQLRDVTF